MSRCALCDTPLDTAEPHESWQWGLASGDVLDLRAHRSCSIVVDVLGIEQWMGPPLAEHLGGLAAGDELPYLDHIPDELASEWRAVCGCAP